MADLNLEQIQIQIQAAVMIVKLGLATVEQVKAIFKDDGHDDLMLSQIMMSVDARIARRDVPPAA